MDDAGFMESALDLAEKGRGCTSPNPMVGAVVVRDGTVVGQGYHRRAGGPHAEVNAIDDAGDAARGATLYVTLEPCNHTGRTPPCTEKILAAGIRRVVVAMADPNPDVRRRRRPFSNKTASRSPPACAPAGPPTSTRFFFKYTTTGRPFVIAKCAATLDGRIATRTGDAQWVTGRGRKGIRAPPAARRGRHHGGHRHRAGGRPPLDHPHSRATDPGPHPHRSGHPPPHSGNGPALSTLTPMPVPLLYVVTPLQPRHAAESRPRAQRWSARKARTGASIWDD